MKTTRNTPYGRWIVKTLALMTLVLAGIASSIGTAQARDSIQFSENELIYERMKFERIGWYLDPDTVGLSARNQRFYQLGPAALENCTRAGGGTMLGPFSSNHPKGCHSRGYRPTSVTARSWHHELAPGRDYITRLQLQSADLITIENQSKPMRLWASVYGPQGNALYAIYEGGYPAGLDDWATDVRIKQAAAPGVDQSNPGDYQPQNTRKMPEFVVNMSRRSDRWTGCAMETCKPERIIWIWNKWDNLSNAKYYKRFTVEELRKFNGRRHLMERISRARKFIEDPHTYFSTVAHQTNRKHSSGLAKTENPMHGGKGVKHFCSTLGKPVPGCTPPPAHIEKPHNNGGTSWGCASIGNPSGWFGCNPDGTESSSWDAQQLFAAFVLAPELIGATVFGAVGLAELSGTMAEGFGTWSKGGTVVKGMGSSASILSPAAGELDSVLSVFGGGLF